METKKKSLAKFITLAALILSAVYIALSASYNLIASDYVAAQTLLPIVIDQLIILCNLASYGICFSVFIYSIYRAGIKKSLPVIFIYSGILLAQKLIDTTLYYIIFGGGWDTEGLLYTSFIWLTEMLLVFAAVLVGHFCTKGKKTKSLSFDKLYSNENALLHSAFILSLVIAIPTIISRIIDHITVGAPSDIIDVLWIIAMYLSHIASGVIVYVISFFVMKKLYKSENI